MDENRPKTAILSGYGTLPREIRDEMVRCGEHPVVIGIRGEIDPGFASDAEVILGYGQLGSFFKFVNDRQVGRIIMAGGIAKRPDFMSLKPDLLTLKEIPRLISITMGGDNSVIGKIAAYFSEHGLEVAGVHEVAPGLLAGQGNLSGKMPKAARDTAIAAFRAAKLIGSIDAGQAAVAEDARVISLEGAEGTDAMLKRVPELRLSGRIRPRAKHGVLAKTMKPGQDMRADLPAIGPATIESAQQAGLNGIIVEAGRSVILERQTTLDQAAKSGIWIYGADEADFGAGS